MSKKSTYEELEKRVRELELAESEAIQTRTYKSLYARVLSILVEGRDFKNSIKHIIAVVKQDTGCDAVGIRLQTGEDYPYFVQNGFSDDFLHTENSLVSRDIKGEICRNPDGSVCIECTCGLVISNKTDPLNPMFSPGGSFWTNDSYPLLDLPAADDPRDHPRNQCIHHGYASVALLPIRAGGLTIGIFQLNDRRKGVYSLSAIQVLEGIAVHIGEAVLRNRTEEALRESEKRYRTVADFTYDWEYWANLDGKMKYMSPSCERISGYGAKDFIENPSLIRDIILEEDRGIWDQHRGEAIKSLGLREVQFRIKKKDGEIRWIEHACQPVIDHKDSLHSIRASNRDITARKKLKCSAHNCYPPRRTSVQG